MAEPVIIPNRPLIAGLLLFFWTAEVAVGLLFAAAGFAMWGSTEHGGAALLLSLGAVLALAGLLMAALCWRVVRLKGAAIELSAAGLLDRRMAQRLIPWPAIRWKKLFNGRSYAIQLDIAEPQRQAAGVFWQQRAMGLFHRLLRQPEFVIVLLGTGLSIDELAEKLQRFHAPVD